MQAITRHSLIKETKYFHEHLPQENISVFRCLIHMIDVISTLVSYRFIKTQTEAVCCFCSLLFNLLSLSSQVSHQLLATWSRLSIRLRCCWSGTRHATPGTVTT